MVSLLQLLQLQKLNKLLNIKHSIAGAVFVVALAFSNPAYADDNPIQGMIKFKNLIEALKSVDIQYEVNRIIQYNLENYGRQKVYEKRIKDAEKNI